MNWFLSFFSWFVVERRHRSATMAMHRAIDGAASDDEEIYTDDDEESLLNRDGAFMDQVGWVRIRFCRHSSSGFCGSLPSFDPYPGDHCDDCVMFRTASPNNSHLIVVYKQKYPGCVFIFECLICTRRHRWRGDGIRKKWIPYLQIPRPIFVIPFYVNKCQDIEFPKKIF